eukprot:g14975.t1
MQRGHPWAIMVVLTKADQCTPDMLNRTMAHVVSFLETMPSSYVWPYVHAVSGLEGHGVDFLRASVSLLTLDPLSAGGFIASHIVKLLLERGHVVRGTLRDAKDPRKTEHLMALPGASERLSLFSASLLEPNAFDEAVQGCRGVFHTASPLVPGKGVEDPETLVLRPAIEGTLNVLRSCQKAGTVKTVVLTSSMSAVAPVPEPPLKLATICPTMVLGPMLQPEVNMTMGAFRGWLKNGVPGHPKCQNDSMSFVDVRDCAAQHVAAMEMEDKAGRFMSLDCSIHWNDLAVLMKSLYPSMPAAEPALTGELLPLLEKAPQARIVVLSSTAHLGATKELMEGPPHETRNSPRTKHGRFGRLPVFLFEGERRFDGARALHAMGRLLPVQVGERPLRQGVRGFAP